jgi:hypothetical protein
MVRGAPLMDGKLWALCIVVGSALDALLTMHHIQRGGSELNPLMALVLDHGFPAFIGMKMVLTIGGVWVLVRYRSIKLACHALRGCAVLYLGIVAYHGLVFWSV